MAFGGGFGGNAFGTSSSAFGNPSQPLFGQSSAPFGQSTSSFGAFGQSAPAFGQSSLAFGQSAPGFAQSAPAFGQSASSFGAFGASQPSLFGQSSSAFGASQPFGASQSFGASQAAFGSSQPAFGAQSQSLFGSSQPAFGQSQPFGDGQSRFAAGWGNQSQQPQQAPSTRSVKYQISQLYDTNSTDQSKFMAITAMEQYQAYSIEELRVADYALGDKSGGIPTGMSAFGGGFSNTGNTGFGAQSGGAFGSSAFGTQSQSGFGAPSQPAFGAQSQSLFGAQSQPSLFGASSGSAFGAASGGLFGSNPNQAQSDGFFGGGGGGNAFGNTGFGSSGFGQSSAAASAFGGFGSTAQSQSLFGGVNQQSSGGLFGGQQQTAGNLFGSQPQSGGGLFGSQPQSGGGLFGSQQQSSGGLFGAQQSGGGLFGAQAQTGSGLFGASSSALGGSTGFGAPFGGQQAPQSAPSLFGASSGAGFGGAGSGSTGGLFGGQTGGSLFGNTGASLFGSGASYGGYGSSGAGLFGAGSGLSLFGSQPVVGASSSSLFGSGFGGGFGTGFGASNVNAFQQQQQQQQGPLEASVTRDPYGQSQLFSSIGSQPALQPNNLSLSTVRAGHAGGQSQGKDIRVVVQSKSEPRLVRGSRSMARQSALLRSSGNNWYSTSPVRHWGPQRSLFDPGTPSGRVVSNTTDRTLIAGWRSEEQKKKAANIRRLVIQPMKRDPILKAASGQRAGLLRGKGPLRRPASGSLVAPQSSGGSEDNQEQPLERRNGRPASLPARPHRSQEQNEPAEGGEVEADAETSIESDPAEENGPEILPEHEIDDQRHPGSKGTPHSFTEVENFSSRYVPYKDYYRMQMRRSRRQSGGSESDERQRPQLAPVSSTSDLQTSPSLAALEKMSAEDLSNVESFKVWKPNVGEIEWQQPVDLRGINLDQTVRIEPKEVCVYPREEDVPAKGEGLNKPAVVRLHGIWKTDKKTGEPRFDASTVAAIVKKLKAHCEEERLDFVGYEVRTGTWTFKAESF